MPRSSHSMCLLTAFLFVIVAQLGVSGVLLSQEAPDVNDRSWTDDEGNQTRGHFVKVQGTKVTIRLTSNSQEVELETGKLVNEDLSLIVQYLNALGGNPFITGATNRVWLLAGDGRKFIGRMKIVDNGEVVIDQTSEDLGIKYLHLSSDDQTYIRERLIEDGRFSLDRLEVTEVLDGDEEDEEESGQKEDSSRYDEETYPSEESDEDLDEILGETDGVTAVVDSLWFTAVIIFSGSVLLLLGLIALKHISSSFQRED